MLGLPLEDAWQDWIEFEHEHQRENLEAIRQLCDFFDPDGRFNPGKLLPDANQ